MLQRFNWGAELEKRVNNHISEIIASREKWI
jgi:hypothetical protein